MRFFNGGISCGLWAKEKKYKNSQKENFHRHRFFESCGFFSLKKDPNRKIWSQPKSFLKNSRNFSIFQPIVRIDNIFVIEQIPNGNPQLCFYPLAKIQFLTCGNIHSKIIFKIVAVR